MTNLIGDITIRDAIFDFTTSSELSGAWDIAHTVINGTTYLYVSGNNDAGIQILTMNANGQLDPAGTFEDTAETGLSGVSALRIAEIGNRKFLVAGSENEAGVTVFQISTAANASEGLLTATDFVTDNEVGNLNRAEFLETVEIGGTVFVITSSRFSDSLSSFELRANGTLIKRDDVLDSEEPDYFFDSPHGIAVATIGSRSFVYVSGSSQPGINGFRISDTGRFTAVESESFGFNSSVESLTFATVRGVPMLIAADQSRNALRSYEVGNDGTLTLLNESVVNRDLYGVQVVEIDGVSFLAASAYFNNTVVLYSIGADGTFEEVQTVSDTSDPEVRLNNPWQIEEIRFGDKVFLVVAGFGDAGVTAVELGAQTDALTGTMASDELVGLAGDDDLIALDGDDTVFGGNGEDVISGRGGDDTLFGGADDDVIVAGSGNDTVNGGAGADIMKADATGRDILDYRGSAAGVTVDLAKGTARGGDAEGDIFVGFEGVIGSDERDVLRGDGAANVLDGLGGNDAIFGGNGIDRLGGDAGNDAIRAGSGDDLAYGDAGNDAVYGDAGADRIFGGDGNDRLFGGADNDTVFGGTGRDTIEGGSGDDLLIGQGSNDVFVFRDGFGGDTIRDFNANGEVIDLRGLTSVSSFADLTIVQISGSAVIIDGADSITLEGVARADLSAADFLF